MKANRVSILSRLYYNHTVSCGHTILFLTMNLKLQRNLKNIHYTIRSYCVVCDKKLENPTIELPRLPLTEIYIKRKPKTLAGFADQSFHICLNCGHGQLERILDPKILYGQNEYFFRTSLSGSAKVANDVFSSFIKRIIKSRKFDSIVEIGASDLYLIKTLARFAKKLVGIDPILKDKEKENSTETLTAIGDFYENVDLGQYLASPKSLIITSHTLEHIADPKQILVTLFQKSHQKTVFIFQFPGFDTLIRDQRYDEIFHQHLHYFSLESFKYLLNEVGGELLNYEINYQHWGSLMVAFRKSKKQKFVRNEKTKFHLLKSKVQGDYKNFQIKTKLMGEYLKSLKSDKIYGYGAALMLPILGYHLQTDFSEFACIIDDDPSKTNLYYINLPISIKPTRSIKDIKSAIIVITALNATRSITPKVIALDPKRILFPLQII